MSYLDVQEQLRQAPRRWLVTGGAGFIGSNLVEALLRLEQQVVVLDNLATGRRQNLSEAVAAAGEGAIERFTFIEGDIRDSSTCHMACKGADLVLHQAALGSVPRSIADPATTHQVNVDGMLNMLLAARDAGVSRMVYASSSSVYGDDQGLPKVETRIGSPLSPYAVTKRVNELYAKTFEDHYGLSCTGLRYFNVFGPRQYGDGPYAAVIPKWVEAMWNDEACTIYGDGSAGRDFCFVDNVVEANILAATNVSSKGKVFNIAIGELSTLNGLYDMIKKSIEDRFPKKFGFNLEYAPLRYGDIKESLASIDFASVELGYEPIVRVSEGIDAYVGWFARFSSQVKT